MKAWQLQKLGGTLSLIDRSIPEPRAGSVVVRMEASSLMSYMKSYVEGKLPVYHAPAKPFIPGGNGIGVIHAVGPDVWQLKPGQRVAISSHFVAQENVSEPGEFLLGVTAVGPVAEKIQNDWADGTLAEYALLPATLVTPVDGLEEIDSTQLVVTMRHIVPYGGLLRGRLAAGETLVVSGATGAYGSAAVLLALAMGASRVVAIGRNAKALDVLAKLGGPRVAPVVVNGDIATDVASIRAAAGGGADMAFDMVGGATDPNQTMAALRSLRRQGRLVLMGSMTVPLPISYLELMMNSWELIGHFMYPRDAYRRLLGLVRSGQLDVTAIRPLVHSMTDLPKAMELAAGAGSLECVVMRH
ncbi:quinone oxidoreductase family protein [Burkholderia cenocepacia]|uniref:quinone oxidoreductase family protein n=1 Tax=Burkholderia cenocepacia TaxID=95486 RepID=UPI00075D8C81|nr:zinc-binding dehydrogenase [Burkholderia cenocepacia]AOK37808.1 alcohol dehydrogenase [Burkholderia cenocepacia]KWF51066.1 alcohol dehydrogenase [Burkholderia cenocepacia]MDF0504656.1 zinc-binding dehydrogenase [Burkholderia cenocepacia]